MKSKNPILILISLICVVVNIAGIILYSRYQDIAQSEHWVEHSQEVVHKVLEFQVDLERMISRQRGYLMTGSQGFVDNYAAVRDEALKDLGELDKLTVDNAHQNSNVHEARAHMVAITAILQKQIDDRAARALTNLDQITVNLTEIKKITDDTRALSSAVLNEEQRLLEQRQAESNRQQNYYFKTMVLSALAGMIVLVIANGFILAAADRHRKTESNLHAAERDLELTRERMELALKGTADGIFDWQVGSEDLFLSSRFRDMLGYDEKTLPGKMKAFTDLIHPDEKAQVLERLDQYINAKIPTYSMEYRLKAANGTWRWHLARKAGQFGANGKAYRLVGAHTDITEQKTLEERLTTSNKELEEYTYIASHDLRSPLVNLKGFAGEMELATKTLTPFVEKALKVVNDDNAQAVREAIELDIPQAVGFIKSSVTKMDKLTQAILELSRVGRRELRIAPLDIRQIVDNCLNPLQHTITTRGITVAVGDLPAVNGDPVAIEQVFGNIIDNAIKYLSPDKPGQIAISGRRGISETTYEISDNGRGIAPEDMHKIFEIFKRAGNNSNIPGEGIGMSFVQATVRRHGGTIWCDSVVGKGTTFYFTIANNLSKGTQNG